MVVWSDKEYARIDETASALGVSVFPIREAIRGGDLSAYKIGRGTVVNVSEVKAWFNRRLVAISPCNRARS